MPADCVSEDSGVVAPMLPPAVIVPAAIAAEKVAVTVVPTATFTAPASGVTAGDAIALIAGTVAYAAMAWLHPAVIGVPVG